MSLEQEGVLKTNIEVIDRKLGGGIPMGTVVTMTATPASQSELFLYEFAATRQTVYLSLIRPEDTVASVLTDRGVDSEAIETVQVDEETPLDDTMKVLDSLPDRTNLVVDPTDVLEECDTVRYRRFLAKLERQAAASDGVVILHCLKDDHTPARRRDTIHVADLVFELTTEIRGDSIVNRLTIPKFRGGQSMEDVIKLDLTTEVEVDMSRNII